MVVDDERDILSVVCAVLEKCSASFDTNGFSNPLAALEKFRQDPSAFDIVLTDIRMPGMLGFELAREIRELKPEIQVAFMSAFDLDERIPGYPQALKKQDIIRKPNGLLDLCKTLERYFVSPN